MNDAPNAGPSRRGWHRLEDFVRCPRRYALRHLIGLTPLIAAAALARGALLHIALMFYYRNMTGRYEHVDPIEAMRAAPHRVVHQFENARKAFVHHVAGRSEDFTVLDVEREFETKLGPYIHTARLDITVLWRKRLFIVDHKSAADPKNSGSAWRHSAQMLLSHALGRFVIAPLYNLPFGGVAINTVSTSNEPSPRALKVLSIDEAESNEAVRFARRVNDRIEAEHVRAGGDPWRYEKTYACGYGNNKCEFFRLCADNRREHPDFIIARDELTTIVDDGA